ncbi:MAG: hypothetical protein JRD68_15895 [Deltaproteobacteria bacterium]|nr:hypothetical protein [Deltaproteobacteria bacterium]
MVKITDEPKINSMPPNTTRPSSKTSGPDFAQKLSQAIGKDQNAPAAGLKDDPLAALTQSAPVGKIMASEMSMPIGQVEKTLGMLDEYTKALADPNQNLKQVSVLVKELEDQAASLNKVSQSLPEGHAVKDLMNRTSVVATVEAIKFRRGDYV